MEGEPTDSDAEEGLLAALNAGGDNMHVSLFQIDSSGNLKLIKNISNAKTANSMALIKLQR